MKALHTVGGMDPAGGGVSTCLADLMGAMEQTAASGDNVGLLTVRTPGIAPLGDGSPWLETVPRDYRTPVALSANLRRAIAASDADIYHTNGLWMHVNHLTAAHARRTGRPFILSPHGMLYPKALNRSRWKKRPLEWAWFRRDILRADAIAATCDEEARHVRAYGYTGRVEVIPNPFVIPPYAEELRQTRHYCQHGFTIGFLGRLHPVKGIELLLDAFARVAKNREMRLVLMGSGDQTYETSLRHRAQALGIDAKVEFTGNVAGRDKFGRLAAIDTLFVPSDFENFGMIVPEALIVGTPVVAARTTPWESLETEQCGLWIDRTVEAVADAIVRMAETPAGQLAEMGRRGAAMVTARFAADAVARRMWNLYKSILK